MWVKGVRVVFRYPFLACLSNERLYPATRLEWTPLSTEEAINKKVPAFLTIKDGTPVVTSYDRAVRITCDNEPGLFRHMLSLSRGIIYVSKNNSDPFSKSSALFRSNFFTFTFWFFWFVLYLFFISFLFLSLHSFNYSAL